MRSNNRTALGKSTCVAGCKATGTSSSPMRRSEEHTSELQSHLNLVCRLLLEKKKPRTHGLAETATRTRLHRLGSLPHSSRQLELPTRPPPRRIPHGLHPYHGQSL